MDHKSPDPEPGDELNDLEEIDADAGAAGPHALCVLPPGLGHGCNDGEVNYKGGFIRFYKGYATFEATCGSDLHTKLCRVTRTSHEDETGEKKAQGRPIVLLAAWLEHSFDEDLLDMEDHHNPYIIQACDFLARTEARAQLKLCEGAAALFAGERPKRADELYDEPLEQA